MNTVFPGTSSADSAPGLSDLSTRSHSPLGMRTRCAVRAKLNTQSRAPWMNVSHAASALNLTAALPRPIVPRAIDDDAIFPCRSWMSCRYHSKSSSCGGLDNSDQSSFERVKVSTSWGLGTAPCQLKLLNSLLRPSATSRPSSAFSWSVKYRNGVYAPHSLP